MLFRSLRHRRLFPHNGPKPFKGDTGLAREALDLRYLRETRKRISANHRAYNLALESERGADHRQALELGYNYCGTLLALRDTAVSAFGKNAGIVPCLIEQLEQWRRVDGAEYGALVGAEQSDSEVRGAAVFLQRPLPEVGAEEPVTGKICHEIFFNSHRW